MQSGPSAELEAQTSKLGERGILLSSLPLDQEEQLLVVLGEVRLCLGAGDPACQVTTKRGLGIGQDQASLELSHVVHMDQSYPLLGATVWEAFPWESPDLCAQDVVAVSFRARRWL